MLKHTHRNDPLLNIPVNVITGFLGVGKTTAIMHLLAHKPDAQRWAVLVNEFGEVGIDGSVIKGDFTEAGGVFIREVPGGCMCCAAGLPMQIALNALLARARPNRLLIEPTGLGHPREVLEVLTGADYHGVLDLRATLTLVDARKLSDRRYTDNAIFNQQLAVADVVVAHKADLYQPHDISQLEHYLAQMEPAAARPVLQASQGQIDVRWLDKPSRMTRPAGHSHHTHSARPFPAEPGLPESGYRRFDNQAAGFVSSGWIFSPHLLFDPVKLYALLCGLQADRAKGVFITREGIVACNMADGVLTTTYLDEAVDSRIELIARDPLPAQLEAQLLDCLDNDQLSP